MNFEQITLYSFSKLLNQFDFHYTCLSDDEKSTANSFFFELLKVNYVNCRGMLRVYLAKLLNCHPKEIQFQYNEFGKPFLHSSFSPSLYFNLSHAGDRFIIAHSFDDVIGVDIEKIKTDIDVMEIGKEVFTSLEFLKLSEYSSNMQFLEFYRMWTIKEAYIKYIGKGFSFDPKDIEIDEEQNSFRSPRRDKSALVYPNFKHKYLDNDYSTAIVY